MNYTVRRDNGNRTIWEQSQIEEVIKLYKQGESCTAIGAKFGVSRIAISRLLKKNNIKVKTPTEFYQEKFPRDSNYFQKIDTPEKAYWLGFLYADGCITCGSLIINLQDRDKEHLEQFRKDIKAVNNQIIRTQKGDKLGWNFSIRDSKMIEDLKKLGCVERKSLILSFPTEDQVPREFIWDFIRGYFDGDGTLSFDRRHRTPQARYGFAGSKQFLMSLQKELEVSTALQSRGEAYAFVVNGNKKAKKFFDKIYNNPSRFLKRKYSLYNQFLSYAHGS